MASKLYKKLKTGTGHKSQKHGLDFIEAVKNEDMERLKKLTQNKVKMCVPAIYWSGHDIECVYPIHIACALGSVDVVKFLFRCGATLETKTDSGLAPLHFAAWYNLTHPEVTEHLLDMGAKTNVKDKPNGYTPFHCACVSNNFGAAKRLLAVTKPTIPDNNNKTAKDIAIENDCEQIVSLFEKWDEEDREKELLRRLPARLEELERKTESLLKHRSIQSLVNDSGMGTPLDNFSLDGLDHGFQNSLPNLISLHVDGSNLSGHEGFRKKCPSAVSLNKSVHHCAHCCNRKSWASYGDDGQYQCQYANCPCSPQHRCRFRDSLSPVKSTFSGDTSTIHEESNQPLTRESPLGKMQRNQVQRNYSMLQSMMKPDRIITKLFSRMHLDLDAKEKLSKMATQKEKNDYIMTEFILKGSMGLYEDFLKILQDTQQGHLADRLARVSDSPLYTSKLSTTAQGDDVSVKSFQGQFRQDSMVTTPVNETSMPTLTSKPLESTV